MTSNTGAENHDPTRQYLDQIGAIPLLTAEQERDHSLHIQIRDHIDVLRRNSIKPRDANATKTILRRIASRDQTITALFAQAGLDPDPKLSDLHDNPQFRQLVDHAPSEATAATIRSLVPRIKPSSVINTTRQISLDTLCVTPPAIHIMADCRLSKLHEAVHDEQLPRRLSQARSHLKQSLDQLHSEGDHRQQALTEANLRLVVSIAKEYIVHNVPLFDLIQEGNIGLITGVQKFDHRRGCRFSTYGTWWIKQHILQCVSTQSRQIHIPDYQATRIRRMREAQQTLSQELGRPPTPEEIAHRLEVPLDRVRETIAISLDPIDLDTPLADDTDTTIGDLIPDDKQDVEQQIERRALRDNMTAAIAALDDDQRQVIIHRYGLFDDTPKSLNEVYRETGIPPKRARHIEADALNRLRHQPELRDLLAEYAT